MTHRTRTPSLTQQRGLISAALIAVIVILATLSALVMTNLSDEDTAESAGGIELSPVASEVEQQEAAEVELEQPSFFSSPAASDNDTATSAPVAQQDTVSDSLPAAAISDDEVYTESTGYSGDDGTATVVYDAEEERKVQEWWGSIQSSLRASESSSNDTFGSSSNDISESSSTSASESASSFTSETSPSSTSETSNISNTDDNTSNTSDTADNSEPTVTSDGFTFSDPTTYCGKTEFELYAWYQVEHNAAFQFMWNCVDI